MAEFPDNGPRSVGPAVSTIILRASTVLLVPALLLASLFMLWRGHDEPGGGFIGGLIGASAIVLYAIAYDVESTRRVLRVDPIKMIGVGLTFALIGGLPALVLGEPYMFGYWLEINEFGLDGFKVGTPLVFDIGVFLTVIGMVLLIILTLAEA